MSSKKEFAVVSVDEGPWLVTLSLRDGEPGGMIPAMDVQVCTDCLPPPVNGRVEFGDKRIQLEDPFCSGTGYIVSGFYELGFEGRGRITIEVEPIGTSVAV